MHEIVVVTDYPLDADKLEPLGLGHWSLIAVGLDGPDATYKLATTASRLSTEGKVVVVGVRDYVDTVARLLRLNGLPVATLDLPAERYRSVGDWAGENPDELTKLVEDTEATLATSPGNLPLLRHDNDMADRVLDHLGGNLIIVENVGMYAWDGRVWKPATDSTLYRAVREVQESLDAQSAEALEAARGDKDATRAIEQYRETVTKYGGNYGTRSAVAQLAGVAHEVDLDDLDRHADLLTFRNGVVHLPTGELRPHDSGLLMTRMVDLDYRPAAPCPLWERFLGDVFDDQPDVPEYMQRLIGYGITGHTRGQVCAVLYGRGGNGKGVLNDVLTELFRGITETISFSTVEKWSSDANYALADLRGARIVVAQEGEKHAKMNEPVIKRITGDDRIQARQIRQQFIQYRPQFLLLLSTNHMPQFTGQDNGIWRRIKLIEFRRFFDEANRDEQLFSKLVAEAEGIVAWAVRGAMAWYEAGKLVTPDSVREGTNALRTESDALAGFVGADDSDAVLVVDPGGEVMLKQAFKAYDEWAGEQGIGEAERVKSERQLKRELVERGINLTSTRTMTGARLKGLRLSARCIEVADGIRLRAVFPVPGAELSA